MRMTACSCGRRKVRVGGSVFLPARCVYAEVCLKSKQALALVETVYKKVRVGWVAVCLSWYLLPFAPVNCFNLPRFLSRKTNPLCEVLGSQKTHNMEDWMSNFLASFPCISWKWSKLGNYFVATAYICNDNESIKPKIYSRTPVVISLSTYIFLPTWREIKMVEDFERNGDLIRSCP